MICPLTTNRGRTRINPADEAAIRLILLFVVIAGAVHSADGEYAVSVEVGDVAAAVRRHCVARQVIRLVIGQHAVLDLGK